MRIAAAMSMAVPGPTLIAAQLQHGDGERRIDIAGAAAAQCRAAGLRQQAIDPQIVVEPDAHEQARMLQTQDVLRLGLIVLGVHARRNETTATTRSPPTASVRLRRSVVVVTTWMRSCAHAGRGRARTRQVRAERKTMDLQKEGPRSGPPCSLPCRRDPDALRHQAMDILLGIGDRADPAIHRHAGEPIGIETRDLLLLSSHLIMPIDASFIALFRSASLACET